MTSYPSSIWAPTSKSDGVDYPQATHINQLQDEVVALETALGVNKVNVLLNPSSWAGSFYAQDAAPSSPAADDLWYETDTNLLWVYGTFAAASRWVSVNLFNGGSTLANQSAGVVLGLFSPAAGFGYDLYLDSLYLKYFVATTLSGSAYWTMNLRKVSGSTATASGAGTLLGAATTQSLTANAWGEVVTSINAALDNSGSGIEHLFLDLIKTSTPGNIDFAASVSFRLIHP